MTFAFAELKEIEEAIKAVYQINKKSKIALLHCVSEYPCPIDKLDLSSIQTLIKNYPDIVVGVSDHFNGTLSGPLSCPFHHGYGNGDEVMVKEGLNPDRDYLDLLHENPS